MLAETYVFGKQLHGFFSCGSATMCPTTAMFTANEVRLNSDTRLVSHTVAEQALFRSYGRCFAEFLDEESLVHLGLLDLSTCVGLRYG